LLHLRIVFNGCYTIRNCTLVEAPSLWQFFAIRNANDRRRMMTMIFSTMRLTSGFHPAPCVAFASMRRIAG
jgi:hypothetical protein